MTDLDTVAQRAAYDEKAERLLGYRCTWQAEDGGPECGQPADAFRVRFDDDGTHKTYYCKTHLRAIRKKTSDDAARKWFGIETMAVWS